MVNANGINLPNSLKDMEEARAHSNPPLSKPSAAKTKDTVKNTISSDESMEKTRLTAEGVARRFPEPFEFDSISQGLQLELGRYLSKNEMRSPFS
jgi:hypothetical protein